MNEATLGATGKSTSEYRRATQANWTLAIAAILGLILQVGPSVVEALAPYGVAGVIAGSVLQVIGIVQKLLVDLGYIKSRTAVKVAAADMNKTITAARHNMSTP